MDKAVVVDIYGLKEARIVEAQLRNPNCDGLNLAPIINQTADYASREYKANVGKNKGCLLISGGLASDLAFQMFSEGIYPFTGNLKKSLAKEFACPVDKVVVNWISSTDEGPQELEKLASEGKCEVLNPDLIRRSPKGVLYRVEVR